MMLLIRESKKQARDMLFSGEQCDYRRTEEREVPHFRMNLIEYTHLCPSKTMSTSIRQ